MPAKMVKRLSSISTERRALPSTPETLSHFVNFRGNVENQRAVRPTDWRGSGWTTPNANGKAATFGGTGTCAESGRTEYPVNHPGSVKV
jgi:hypothetical protein